MSEEENTSAPLGSGLSETPAPESTQTESPNIDFGNTDLYKQFVETLPDELKTHKTFHETENFQSLANQLVNAQSALGKKRLEAPQQDWTEDQWNDYYEQIRPEEGEYEIPDSINLPEGYDSEKIPEFDDSTLQDIVDLAGTMGLSQNQFNQLFGAYNTMIMDAESMNASEQKETLEKYNMDLRGEWGNLYEKNLEASNQAYEAIAGDIPEIRELVEGNPYVANHPGVLKLFNKIAEISGDSLPVSSNSNAPSAFAASNVHNLKAQIQDLDTTHSTLIMTNPASLPMDQRTKRQEILDKRADLYAKLYSEG